MDKNSTEGLENYIALLRRDLQQARDEADQYYKWWAKEVRSSSKLRDQFAIAALTGISTRSQLSAQYAAILAYETADAMLKAREPK